jgi:hypothetical protein
MGTGSREERQVRGEGKTDPAWFCSAKTSPATGYCVGKSAPASFPQAVSGQQLPPSKIHSTVHFARYRLHTPLSPHFPHFPHSGRSSRLHRADRRERWRLFSSGVPSGLPAPALLSLLHPVWAICTPSVTRPLDVTDSPWLVNEHQAGALVPFGGAPINTHPHLERRARITLTSAERVLVASFFRSSKLQPSGPPRRVLLLLRFPQSARAAASLLFPRVGDVYPEQYAAKSCQICFIQFDSLLILLRGTYRVQRREEGNTLDQLDLRLSLITGRPPARRYRSV